MKINRDTLEKIAHLARLEINEKDVPRMLDEMTRMVDFVEKLNEVDTEGIEPLTTMSHEINSLREDEVKNQLTKEQVLSNAPSKDDNFFCVPKVIE